MATEQLVIIGSGPAGYTAAIYAARASLNPLLIEGLEPGGQLMQTTEVENFPGFPKGVQGPELMQLLKEQAARFGTRFISEEVVSIDMSKRPFTLKTPTQEITASAVILATGASATRLNVPGEKEYYGRGVSACATCDGFFFKNKQVVVVGGGDSALEEATFLTRFATSVTIMVRRDVLRASQIMQDRAKANPKISFMWNTEVKEVQGDGTKVTTLKILNNKTNTESLHPTDGVFAAIGHTPNTGVFKGQITLDAKGYLTCVPNTSLTNVEGIFAAGDVADHRYRQAVTAAGTGCMAAIDAERWLEVNK